MNIIIPNYVSLWCDHFHTMGYLLQFTLSHYVYNNPKLCFNVMCALSNYVWLVPDRILPHCEQVKMYRIICFDFLCNATDLCIPQNLQYFLVSFGIKPLFCRNLMVLSLSSKRNHNSKTPILVLRALFSPWLQVILHFYKLKYGAWMNNACLVLIVLFFFLSWLLRFLSFILRSVMTLYLTLAKYKSNLQ